MQDLAVARRNFLRGEEAPEGVRPVVLASWQRCHAYGLNPEHLLIQEVDRSALEQARDRNRQLLRSADPFLDLVHQTLSDQPHLVVVADSDGTILHALHAGVPDADLAESNLVEGASWHERDIGCNGIGTCLAEGEPVILMGPEHFQESYTGWTCIGVPIRDSAGTVVGALDLSLPNDHTSIHSWGWTLSIAKAIEESLQRSAHPAVEADPRVSPDIDEPLQSIRGVFDLLATQLHLPRTHAQFLDDARAEVLEAERRLVQMVASLQSSEQRLRRISESGMVGLLYWDLDGRVTYANDRYLKIVRYTREDLEQGLIDWKAMTPPEWNAVDAKAIEELRTRGATTPFEKEFIRKDGRRVSVLLTAATFNGSVERGLTLVHDISEAKEAELRVRRSYEEAQQALHERDAVLAIVSHDLRNPLNTLSMASGLLLEDLAEEKKQAQAVIIRRAVEQMDRLVKDLLDAARIEGGGGLALSREAVPATEVVQNVAEMFASLAEAKGLTIRVEATDEGEVLADPDRITQVFGNLISNAAHHMPEGGEIALGAEPWEDGFFRFSVRDSGPGIAAEHLSRVFDRFWQAEKNRRTGAGLGLAIAKGIIEGHGGRIWVESQIDIGCTFSFTLPRA
jgi:PAS domain S-box-containing protein